MTVTVIIFIDPTPSLLLTDLYTMPAREIL